MWQIPVFTQKRLPMDFIRSYFAAERAESLLFLGIGLVALFTAGWFWFEHAAGSFYRGMAVPLAGVGLIQLVVGVAVFFRTPADVRRVEGYWREAPDKLRSEEIPRMQEVMRNFVTYRWMEITLSLAGLILILLVRQVTFWKGVGAGLFLQAGIMLLLDFFAERRGQRYLEALEEEGR